MIQLILHLLGDYVVAGVDTNHRSELPNCNSCIGFYNRLLEIPCFASLCTYLRLHPLVYGVLNHHDSCVQELKRPRGILRNKHICDHTHQEFDFAVSAKTGVSGALLGLGYLSPILLETYGIWLLSLDRSKALPCIFYRALFCTACTVHRIRFYFLAAWQNLQVKASGGTSCTAW